MPDVKYQLKRSLASKYKQGWSLVEIATHYGFGTSTVRRALVAFGVTIRGRGRPCVMA